MNPPKSYRLVFDITRLSGYGGPGIGIGLSLIGLVSGYFLFSGLVLFSSISWLFERNEWQFYRMLVDKEPQLVLRPSGIDIVQKRKTIFIKWKDVHEMRIGIREMDSFDENVELYVYTYSQGSMCLPIEQLSIKNIQSFKAHVDEWWAWAKAERIRKAMGAK